MFTVLFPSDTASSWCTTVLYRNQPKSFVTCPRTERSHGRSPRCPCSTPWRARSSRPCTQTATTTPACLWCRHSSKCSHSLLFLVLTVLRDLAGRSGACPPKCVRCGRIQKRLSSSRLLLWWHFQQEERPSFIRLNGWLSVCRLARGLAWNR